MSEPRVNVIFRSHKHPRATAENVEFINDRGRRLNLGPGIFHVGCDFGGLPDKTQATIFGFTQDGKAIHLQDIRRPAMPLHNAPIDDAARIFVDRREMPIHFMEVTQQWECEPFREKSIISLRGLVLDKPKPARPTLFPAVTQGLYDFVERQAKHAGVTPDALAARVLDLWRGQVLAAQEAASAADKRAEDLAVAAPTLYDDRKPF